MLVMLGENYQPIEIMLGKNPQIGVILSIVFILVSSSCKNETDFEKNYVSLSNSLKNEINHPLMCIPSREVFFYQINTSWKP